MGSPEVYLRSKVPEDMYDTLQKFAELRKLNRMELIKDFNLWPFSDKLEILERKYGDSLYHMDLYGVPAPKRRRRNQDSQDAGETAVTFEDGSAIDPNTITSGLAQTQQSKKSISPKKPKFQRDTTKRKEDTDCKNDYFE